MIAHAYPRSKWVSVYSRNAVYRKQKTKSMSVCKERAEWMRKKEIVELCEAGLFEYFWWSFSDARLGLVSPTLSANQRRGLSLVPHRLHAASLLISTSKYFVEQVYTAVLPYYWAWAKKLLFYRFIPFFAT